MNLPGCKAASMACSVASPLLRSRVVIVVADGRFYHPRVREPNPLAESTPAGYGSGRSPARDDPHAWHDAEGSASQVGVHRALPPPRLRLAIRAADPAHQAG